MAPNQARVAWRLLGGLLLALPLILFANALLMLRELEQARGTFLRNKAAETAARLEQMPVGQLLEEEPSLIEIQSFAPSQARTVPLVGRLLSGEELFRVDGESQGRYRVWVPFHAGGETHVARIDLDATSADFLTARPRRNLYLSIAVALIMAAVTLYAVIVRERQARLARMAELGQMSAVLAHEIRNPLGALKGFLQLAHERSTGDTRLWLDTSLEQTHRLEQLVKDLLLYARAPQPRLRAVSAAEMAARWRPHAPEAEFTVEDFQLQTDPDMLEQAVVNLLRNAQEAGSVVRLHATPGCIQVFDDGPGLPAEVREKLFQPFVTTKAQGTGLGLAIVRNLAHALGMEIRFSDARPVGTCVELIWNARR